MKRSTILRVLLTLVLVTAAAAGGYIAAAWHYNAGPFQTNTVRDVELNRELPRAGAMPINLRGIGNFYQVSAELFRGEQPLPEGFDSLKTIGVKTVVNLREDNDEQPLVEKLGLKYFHIQMNAAKTPNDADVVNFLKIVTDKSNWPLFVHCREGADRTGTMVAVYRVVVQGWTKDQALLEMTQGGFHFHSFYDKLPAYISTMDVERLRREAGIK